MKKDKARAMEILAEARALERTSEGWDVDIPKMIDEACNLCPHENTERRYGIATEGLAVWRCLDCGNDNYVRLDQMAKEKV